MEVCHKARHIINSLVCEGHTAVLAGGCVRDWVMDRQPKDFDIATSATPQQVLELFPHSVRDGESQGVIKVIVDGSVTDVATLRKDGNYTDGRRPDSVEFTDSLEEDSRRRDFTMNAMFYDVINDNVIDFHDGQSHIKARHIHPVGDPLVRFMEDKLRMMRAIRFSVHLGFHTAGGIAGAIRLLAPDIREISGERIREELLKIMAGGQWSASNGVTFLLNSGLLEFILPEVSRLRNCSQDPVHHPEGDVLSHSLNAQDAIPDGNPLLSLAGLLHDIGKYDCRQVRIDESTGRLRISNLGHAERGAEMIDDIAKRLAMSNQQRDYLKHLISNHMRMHSGDAMRKSKLVQLLRDPLIHDMITLQHADAMGAWNKDKSLKSFYLESLATLDLSIKTEPILKGRDLIELGFEPGKIFKEILDYIRDAQDEGLIRSKEDAIRIIEGKLNLVIRRH